ncbi:elicitor-responsive protein 1 [Andrographis paniculata]|uniref:elicitor-responsive protein 1 n=1 Tax=Andrographis paniculata TaxID=175694 RepID=UPI0021E841AA|nr:elicitor-responsive protein 1 [Andrographis paniculata]
MALGTLEVTLLGARGLTRTDLLGKIEPYVVMEYRKQQHTSSIAKGTAPLWNQKFRFTVEHEEDEHEEDVAKSQNTLSLILMDYDTFTQDDSLGQTTIHLGEAIQRGVENGKAEIGSHKYRVVAKDGTYCGELHVAITFTRKKESKEHYFGGWKQSQSQF